MDHGSQFSDVAHYNSAKCDFYMPLIGGETPQSLVETKTDPEMNRHFYLTPIADDIIHKKS